MQKTKAITAALVIFTLFYGLNVFGQPGMKGKWKGSGGWGPGSQYGRMYDPGTVETITGEIVTVDKITPRKGMSYGVHLMVQTADEKISVHLGPGWFIENQDISIEPNDKVTITGSRITFEGKPAMIAAEITKGDNVLELRNENGYPAWAGWRNGRQNQGMRWRHRGAPAEAGPGQRMYNPGTVETLSGEVIEIEKVPARKGRHQGVHLTLKTANEKIAVHLGPDWFVENQDTKIEKNDKVEVKGSKITLDGQPAIIAAEIKKGGQVLELRNEYGLPAWRGWRSQ